jgi:hypothetical protein
MYRRIGQFVDTHGQIKTGQLELTEDAAAAGGDDDFKLVRQRGKSFFH